MYMARNYNYSTAVFFLLSIGFYKILNKVVITVNKYIIIIKLLFEQYALVAMDRYPVLRKAF